MPHTLLTTLTANVPSGAWTGSARCVACGLKEATSRAGVFVWSNGTAAHRGCIELYVLFQIMRELDLDEAPNEKLRSGTGDAAPQQD